MSESSGRLRVAILRAIDHIRNRRVRPDRDRIVEAVLRNQDIRPTREEILKELSKAVEEEAVLKVKYKEGFSYRNPKTSSTRGSVVSEKDIPSDLAYAISQTLRKVLSSSEDSVTIPALVEALRRDFPDIDIQDDHVEEAVDEEVSLGNCVRLAPALIGPASATVNSTPQQPDTEATKMHDSKKHTVDVSDGDSQSSKAEDTSSPGSRGRPHSQRKRVKKTLDPDMVDPNEYNATFTTTKRTKVVAPPRPTTTVESPVVVIPAANVMGIIDRRSKEYRDCLLKCTNCSKKGSPDSDISLDTLQTLRQLKWKCSLCLEDNSICCFCRQSGGDFTCVSCLDLGKDPERRNTFHYKCLFSWGNYEEGKNYCASCYMGNLWEGSEEEQPDEQDKEVVVKEESSPPPQPESLMMSLLSKPLQPRENSSPNPNPVNGNDLEEPEGSPTPASPEVDQPKIEQISNGPVSVNELPEPDTSASKTYRERKPDSWSVSEVVDYLRSIGYDNEARIFRDQEIDGRSLLLLKRDDVLKGMGLKVGPAVKIYSIITHLQNNFIVVP